MTKESIENMREILMPFVAKKLKEINYEGLGESDAKEFTQEFNEILNLAEDALKQNENKEMAKTIPEIAVKCSCLIDEAYTIGLNEAWECAKKIVSANGLKFEQLREIFGERNFLCILDGYSPSEAIDKIEEYEVKKKFKESN